MPTQTGDVMGPDNWRRAYAYANAPCNGAGQLEAGLCLRKRIFRGVKVGAGFRLGGWRENSKIKMGAHQLAWRAIKITIFPPGEH